jgi:O-antigen/teichoic acid export membrane protein
VTSARFTTSFVRDNAVVLAGTLLAYGQGIVLMPVIIKNVGSETYGGFVVLSSILSVVFGLSSLGIGYTAARMMPSTADVDERRRLYIPQFAFQLSSICVLSILLLLIDGPIRTFVFKNQLEYSPMVVPAYLLSYVLYAQSGSYFRFTSRLAVMTTAGLAFPILNIAIVLGVLYFDRGITINLLVLAQAAAAFLVALPMAWTIRREIGMRLSLGARAALVADWKLGFPLVLNFVVDFLLAASDRWIISVYMGLSAVAYYYPAYVIGSLIMFVPRAMSTTLPQLLARAVDGNQEIEAQRMLDYAIRIFLLLALPFIVGCMVLGRPLLRILGNEDVAQGGHAVVPIVAVGAVFFGLSLLLSNVLFVRRRPAAIFRMNTLAAAVNVLWNLVLLYFVRDILVAAWSTLAGYVIAFGYVLRSLGADWRIDWHPQVIVKSMIASAVMGGVLVALRLSLAESDTVAMIALEIVIGAATYGCALMAVGGVSAKEIAFMKAQIPRF